MKIEAISSKSGERFPVTSLSWEHVVGDHANFLIVMISTSSGPSPIDYVTFAGSLLTKLREDLYSNWSTSIWYLMHPRKGTHMVYIRSSAGATLCAGCISLEGVALQDPFKEQGFKSGIGSSVQIDFTSDVFCLGVLSVLNTTVTDGQTQLWMLSMGYAAYASKGVGSYNPRSNKLLWSFASSKEYVASGVQINPREALMGKMKEKGLMVR